MLFSNEYCDLLVHASFTKFTGPANLFLNNIIINLKKIYKYIYKYIGVSDFWGDKAYREVG